MKKFDEFDMEEVGAILGGIWCSQTAKQDGDIGYANSLYVPGGVWKERNERPNVGGVSIRSRGAVLRLERDDAWSMAK